MQAEKKAKPSFASATTYLKGVTALPFTDYGSAKSERAFLVEAQSIRVFAVPDRETTFQNEISHVFRDLVYSWKQETRFHSSLAKKFMHPAYQTIMAMGRDAISLILLELEKAPGHWFYALRFIVRKDVAENTDGFEDAREAWLKWGRDNHYI